MSFYELFQEEAFRETFEEVEEFTKRKLSAYNDQLTKLRLSDRNKEIFDAVWGNIEFSAGEIYILDSPLLQRLRNIKQLGLAYFVYCGSDYSRFYHTTGVVFLANRMAVSLNKCNIGEPEEREYFRSVVRLAAIFHDVGHMFLSHVSEHYFAKSPLFSKHEKINEMLEEFERRACKNVALHELLGCMIVNTAEVKRLLRCVEKRLTHISLDSDDDLEKLVEYISGLIVGVPVDRAILPYSSIINGPIDADKCDYLSRDSHVTRVPVAVDISRLTQKLSVVETTDINTSELWHMEADTARPYYELAMSDSAEKALFQLCIARTIMFDSVYYHHKVLTAETELRGLLNKLAHLEDPLFTSFIEILEYTDRDFNRYFFEQLIINRKGSDVQIIREVQAEWEKIDSRNMAKRIACIMPEFLEGTQGNREKLFDSILTSLNSPEQEELIRHVQAQYREICVLLNKPIVDHEACEIFVVQSPTNVYGHSKIQVPIDLHNGKKREFRGYELVNSRETSSSASYFVTNAEYRYLMYLALEKVLYQEYHIILKDECSACGKFTSDEERGNCMKLLNAGYYNDAPELIRDSILYNYIPEEQIKKIHEKFATYEGPEGHALCSKEIHSFFKQVLSVCDRKSDCRLIVQGISQLLMKAMFVNRSFVVDSISDALKDVSVSDSELMIVPLGSSKDSAKHMMYYFNDVHIAGKQLELRESLMDVLRDDSCSTVIFFDDGSYSGNQLVSIMQEYMGVPEQERTTTEHHVEALEEVYREHFRNMTVIYAFLMFNSDNRQEVETALHKIGFTDIQFAYSRDLSRKILDQPNLFDSKKQQQLVKNFLSKVGYEVMQSIKKVDGTYKPHWDEDRIKASALGYNDAQQMVFLKSSVPTYTITAFWQHGWCHGVEWKPLFRRTQKDD